MLCNAAPGIIWNVAFANTYWHSEALRSLLPDKAICDSHLRQSSARVLHFTCAWELATLFPGELTSQHCHAGIC